jgi:hypothetical protein
MALMPTQFNPNTRTPLSHDNISQYLAENNKPSLLTKQKTEKSYYSITTKILAPVILCMMKHNLKRIVLPVLAVNNIEETLRMLVDDSRIWVKMVAQIIENKRQLTLVQRAALYCLTHAIMGLGSYVYGFDKSDEKLHTSVWNILVQLAHSFNNAVKTNKNAGCFNAELEMEVVWCLILYTRNSSNFEHEHIFKETLDLRVLQVKWLDVEQYQNIAEAFVPKGFAGAKKYIGYQSAIIHHQLIGLILCCLVLNKKDPPSVSRNPHLAYKVTSIGSANLFVLESLLTGKGQTVAMVLEQALILNTLVARPGQSLLQIVSHGLPWLCECGKATRERRRNFTPFQYFRIEI